MRDTYAASYAVSGMSRGHYRATSTAEIPGARNVDVDPAAGSVTIASLTPVPYARCGPPSTRPVTPSPANRDPRAHWTGMPYDNR